MGSLRNVANAKTGLPFFELERQAGTIYGNDENDWNRVALFNRKRRELFERSPPVR
jgi:hypothetical protein